MASGVVRATAVAAALLMSAPGCLLFRSGIDTVTTNRKMSQAAKQSWERIEPQYEDSPFEDEIEDGYRLGYKEFVFTGCSHGPCALPEKFLLPRYQTCFGRKGVQAYIEAYRMGARAAAADCAGLHGVGGPRKPSAPGMNSPSQCPCAKCQARRAASGATMGSAFGNGGAGCSHCGTSSSHVVGEMAPCDQSCMDGGYFEFRDSGPEPQLSPMAPASVSPAPATLPTSIPTETAPAPRPVPEGVLPSRVPVESAPVPPGMTSTAPDVNTLWPASELPATSSVPTTPSQRGGSAPSGSQSTPISLPRLQPPESSGSEESIRRWRPTPNSSRGPVRAIPEAALPVENR